MYGEVSSSVPDIFAKTSTDTEIFVCVFTRDNFKLPYNVNFDTMIWVEF